MTRTSRRKRVTASEVDHTAGDPSCGFPSRARVVVPLDAGAAQHASEQFDVIASMLGRWLPKVDAMLRNAREDLLVFTGLPISHW